MKRVVSDRYDESYFEETMENGLHVVLWNKPGYKKSLFMLATPLGAMDMVQRDEEGNEYHFPAGIAHFLEHKMFEMGEQDVMDLFSKMGANVNASTSYTETVYYFSTSNAIEKPLTLLLDFVQSLQISEASVEKEKGIIIQELNMYEQMPDVRLVMETFSSLYQKHPLKYDIGGDVDSVNAITLDELRECYRRNYHPSTMVLIGIGDFQEKEVMDLIRQNQAKKTFPDIPLIHRAHFEEPKEVARPSFSFTMDVSTPKIACAYKLKGIKDSVARAKLGWCFKMMLDARFSPLNNDFQTWLDDGIINDFVGSEVVLGKDYGILLFYTETKKPQRFEEIAAQTIKSFAKNVMDEAVLQRLKRRYFGRSIRSLNSFEDIAISYIRDYFDGLDFFRSLDHLYSITLQDLKQASILLQDAQVAYVELMPEKAD